MFPRFFLIGIVCLFSIFSFAQERPKLGLVLSGGGAKGIAHVGILKAMEEAGLRPDYIAGTSMGAVVGGLYAMGYSADEIEEMILAVDWNDVLSNNVPLNYISYEEKEYYGRYLLEFPIERLSLKLPSGLIEGQILSEMLHYYFWPSIPYEDFDSFPIGFRCVATDVNTGEPIVFERGPVTKAIRASMAIPSAFTAVDLDSTMAVDGGVVKNFPVDIVRKLGADFVIGVDVSYVSDAAPPENMVGILMNLAMLQSDKTMPEMIQDCDIYVHPDLTGYNTASFTKAKEILEIGRYTGKLYLPQFRALSLGIEMHKETFEKVPPLEEVVLEEVSFSGNQIFGNRVIQNKLGIAPGDTLTREALREAIRRVYGINGFSQVGYEVSPGEKNRVSLNIKMREKLRNTLFASVHVDNVFATGLLLNLTNRNLLGRNSRSVFILDISSNPKFRFDYYKYIGTQNTVAFNFRYDFITREIPTYDQGEVDDIISSRSNSIQFNILTTQSLKQSFLAGFYYLRSSGRSDFSSVLPDGVGRFGTEITGLQAAYFRNSLNNRNFPTSGTEFTLFSRAYMESDYSLTFEEGVDSLAIPVFGGLIFSVDDLDMIISSFEPSFYTAVFLDNRNYHFINPKNQFISSLTAGITISQEGEEYSFEGFNLGGHQRVYQTDARAYGYNFAELNPLNFAMAGLTYQRVLFGNLFLRGGANLIGVYDHVPVTDLYKFSMSKLINENMGLGYGLDATLRSRLGPISVGISRNTNDEYFRYYFSYGFSFNYSD